MLVETKVDHPYRLAYLLLLPASWVVVPLILKSSGSVTAASQLMFLRCPLNFFFGITCPTCGLTRSVLAAWSGNFSSAQFYHPLGVPLWLTTLGIWFILLSFELGLAKSDVWQSRALAMWERALASKWLQLSCAVFVAAYAYWGFFLREPLN